MSLILSNKSIESYFLCKYKSWLILQGQIGDYTSYEKYQKKKLYDYKIRARDHITKKYNLNQLLCNPNDIIDVKNDSYRMILDISITSDNYSLNIDAIEKSLVLAKNKYSLTPILFHHKDKIIEQKRILLSFHVFVLSEILKTPMDQGFILKGDKFYRYFLKCGDNKDKLNKILKEFKRWENNPPSLCLNKHCNICEFKKLCISIARKEDHLSLIENITQTEIKNWNNKGIFTITQLSYNFRPRRKGKRVKIETPKHYHTLKALAIRENKIYIFETPKLTTQKIKIFLDVEYIPDTNFYYLIGLKLVSDTLRKQYFLWADSKNDENQIMRSFLNILKPLNNYTVFHYGSLERKFFRKIKKILIEKSDQETIDKIINNSCNVLTYLYSYIYFPTHSNGLKAIAKYLGFIWQNPKSDALVSIIWRDQWDQKKRNFLKNNLLKYNSDDLMALELVYEGICNILNYKKIKIKEQYIEATDTRILKKSTSFWGRARFGRVKFVFDELEYINRCSYFDYQREKIQFRNSKNIVKDNTNRKKTNKIKLNKTINYNCRKCPFCQSYRLVKDTLKYKDKISYDLKLTENGIKKWITLHKAFRFKCPNCNKSFYKKTFNKKKIPKFEHNLRSWIVYQYIINRLSYQNIERYIKDIFKFDMNFQAISKAKEECVNKYIRTYDNIIRSIISGQVIHIDETKINLKNDSGYIWVMANKDKVVYIPRPDRAANFLKDLLKGFKGILVSDFFSGYDSIDCIQQKCLVHLIRDLNSDLNDNPFDEEYKLIVYKFTILLKNIIDTIDKYGFRKRNLNKHKKDVNHFYKFLSNNEFQSNLSIKYQKRFIKNKDKLFTFLNHSDVTWNNNFAENAIKYIAKWRRLINGRVSNKGVFEYCVFMSIYQTCERNKENFLKFMISKKQNLRLIENEVKKPLENKEGRMFIRTKKFYRKDGRVIEYEMLVENYKHAGKVKQKHLMSLGKKGEIDPKRIEKIIRALIKKTPKLRIVKSESPVQ